MLVKLRLTNGKDAGKVYPVWKSPFLLGRHAECDLRVGSPQVSVHHCVILVRDGEAWVRDVGSTNGTFVNDERVAAEEDHRLTLNDVLRVGPALFTVIQEPTGLRRLDDKKDYTSTVYELRVPPPQHDPPTDRR